MLAELAVVTVAEVADGTPDKVGDGKTVDTGDTPLVGELSTLGQGEPRGVVEPTAVVTVDLRDTLWLAVSVTAWLPDRVRVGEDVGLPPCDFVADCEAEGVGDRLPSWLDDMVTDGVDTEDGLAPKLRVWDADDACEAVCEGEALADATCDGVGVTVGVRVELPDPLPVTAWLDEGDGLDERHCDPLGVRLGVALAVTVELGEAAWDGVGT